MRKRALRCSGLGLALLLQCLTLPSRALACVVGTCTESALDACLPGGGSFDGTVTFNCGPIPVTITVTSTKTISADTTIDGGGVITISGGNSVGVFSVNTGVKFTVQNLAIANGNSANYGGGIYSWGTLTVTNSTFSGNRASGGGGIFSWGTLTVTNSTFSGNSVLHGDGGAIVNAGGTLTVVTNSTFSGNIADDGGAIENSGPLTVTNTTFSSNGASTFSNGGGGGIYNGGGTLTVTNSTFSGNIASGGGGIVSVIFNETGTVSVTNSTFSGNSADDSGAIENYGPLTVTNTIVANSTSGGNCAGTITDGGHNIDDGTTCGFTGGSTNPVLDPAGLKNNGGPTQTIALQATSAAVDGGDETVCFMTTGTAPVNSLDQRGFARPGAGHTHCSIGAFEFYFAPVACAGDCSGDGQVTVDEILTLVNIALGNTPVTTCEAGDANHDGQITVDEILTAVNNALNGCG